MLETKEESNINGYRFYKYTPSLIVTSRVPSLFLSLSTMALFQQHNMTKFLLVVVLCFLSCFAGKTKCSSSTESIIDDYTDVQQEIMFAMQRHGYKEMARSVDSALEIFYPATTNVPTTGLTIFAPTDEGLLSLETPMSPEEQLINIPPPPLDSTMLMYHMVPLKLEPNNFTTNSSLPTLLYGHNLTVTTSPHNMNNPSINNVTIKDWNIYNDGLIVVHGVERFFDLRLDTSTAATANAPAPTHTHYKYNNAAAPPELASASPTPSKVHHHGAASGSARVADKYINQLLLFIGIILSACVSLVP